MTSALLPASALPPLEAMEGLSDPVMKVVEGFPSYPSMYQLASALALATRVPFNPNARQLGSGKPLLHSILALAHQGAPISQRVLPRRLEDLEKVAALGQKEDAIAPLDVEWLASIVLAAGADPWVSYRTQASHDGYDALDLAMNHNLPLLVEVLLESPGAPTAAERCQSLPPSAQRGTALSWWNQLVSQRDRIPLLETLSRHGAQHSELDANGDHPLSQASPEVVLWYAQQGWLPTDKSIQARLQSQWVARSKQAGLTLDELRAMGKALVGEEGAVFQHHKALVGGLLTHPLGHSAQPSGFTQEELLAHVDITRGPSRGHWTGLAALAVAHWRCGSSFNIPNAFEWSNRVKSSVAKCERDEAGNWASPAWMGQPGVLKSALGVEWMPGICLDGVLALQASLSPDREEASSALYVMLGVTDPKAWALASLGDAARFTVALLEKTRSESFLEGAVWLWNTLVDWLPNPNEWGAEGWKHAYEVGKALRGIRLSPKTSSQSYDIQARLDQWYGKVLSHPPVAEPDLSYVALMSIERALLVPSDQNLTQACEALVDTQLSSFAKQAIEEYAQWPEVDDRLQKTLVVVARAAHLQGVLESGQAPRKAPRF